MEQIITRSEAKQQQLSHYFTGKPCKHGHVDIRRTKDTKCAGCDRMYGAQFREARPDVMTNWRKENPGYASQKYQENKEERSLQTKEWYYANRDHVLQKHKEWYYDPNNRDRIVESRKEWYRKNPGYDRRYYARNRPHFLQNISPVLRKRFYQKRKAKLHAIFKECAANYTLPDSPSEHDFKYWIAGEISNTIGLTVYKEVFIDKERTSRIDLLIPSHKIGIELKLSNSYGNTTKDWAQVARYQSILPDHTIYLVSLDGTIGMSVSQLFEKLNNKKPA